MRVRSILLLCLAPFVIGALPGCGGDDPPTDGSNSGALGECPPDSDAQAAEGYDALQGNCDTCHAKDKEGDLRFNAPAEINVDDPASVSAHAETILAEIEEGAMPPGVKLPDATIENIRVYLACDAAN